MISNASEKERFIKANDSTYNAQFNYATNYIKTSKYTLLTFLPLNLFEQFQRLANFYFLCLMMLQMISIISSLTPITTSIPLIGVLTISAIKDAYDDYQRHVSDDQVNNRISKTVRNGHVVNVKWKDVHVGDVILMEDGQFVAADVLLLSTSEPSGLCFIETAELDGETNLKCRQCLAEVADLAHEVTDFDGFIRCEAPNNLLNKFHGILQWNGKELILNNDHIILRGCVLRNTEWCYGMVIFAGRDTKLMQNSGKSKFKRTNIDRLLNFLIIGIVLFLFLLCLSCMIGSVIWEYKTGWYFQMYLPWDSLVPSDRIAGSITIGTLVFFSYAIVLNTLVPISLYVSVEVVRFVQSFFINWDEKMYDKQSGTSAKARTTSLNEELGQIQYIFSDKTGTMTKNIMTFKKCSINGIVYGDLSEIHYGKSDDVIKTYMDKQTPSAVIRSYNNTNYNKVDQGVRRVTINSTLHLVGPPPVDFSWNPQYESDFLWYDQSLVDAARQLNNETENTVVTFFEILALCHTVMPSWKNGILKYQAQSPDESALVSAARNFGIVFIERTPNSVTIEIMGKIKVYELLCILDFNNTRRRMSVVFRENNKIRLYCKGADSVIFNRLEPGNDEYKATTLQNLNEFAGDGLRTLCCAVRDIDDEFFESWKHKYMDAAAARTDREEKLDNVYDEIETHLRLIGITAIEDKLQDAVPKTISNLLMAGIYIWMLTGDKQETAINIGYSCQLLNDEMELWIVDGHTQDQVEHQLDQCNNSLLGISEHHRSERNSMATSIVRFSEPEDVQTEENEERTFALVINGHSLVHALHTELEYKFVELCTKCKAVICCRVTPLQKAMVVQLIKKYKNAVTLAIGDGANDVSMIKEAHIGVGITGQEGNQATLASDYSLGQFRFLERLLLVHGRWSYYRMCKFLRYFFYKNVAFTLCHIWFGFFCGFSAQTIFDPFYISVYNMFYTALPVLAIGALDQDVNDSKSIMYPKLYTPGLKNMFFNTKEFFKCAALGTYASLVIFFVPYGAYFYGMTSSGLNVLDHMYMAEVVAMILVTAMTVQVAFDTSYWTVINHIVIWGSLTLFFVAEWVYNYLIGGAYVGSLAMAMKQPTFWLVTLLVVVVIISPVVAWRLYFLETSPVLTDKLRLKQLKQMRQVSGTDTRMPSIKHKRRSIRSGYAFAHQEGFGRLITSGKIMRTPRNSEGFIDRKNSNISDTTV
ncbi:phospholipid-transporting ATPase ID isoform X1 [Aphis gossypii]|uniref:phospholipid-transporting ATPase ID isoform X1 n=1 Tax=Aphis gossypii TaxID=80765 RepID=UPI002158FAEF|nr:phospholipid-transporting ATPase ID isoform X1 [Aphis gossypii]XP_050059933.1 phospholipid-transporting ATPase ID isoform X1 [Aphis gossypii]